MGIFNERGFVPAGWTQEDWDREVEKLKNPARESDGQRWRRKNREKAQDNHG